MRQVASSTGPGDTAGSHLPLEEAPDIQVPLAPKTPGRGQAAATRVVVPAVAGVGASTGALEPRRDGPRPRGRSFA